LSKFEEINMPTYSGNLVGQTGTDGTISTGVAANYRRAIAPFSNFGTRQIAFFKVTLTGTNLNNGSSGIDYPTNENTQGQEYAINDVSGNTVVPAAYIYPSNSNVYAALNGVAIAAEIALVGGVVFANANGATSSATATFVVGAYIDTAASENADMQHAALANANAQTIQTAVSNAVNLGAGAAVAVVPVYFNGGSLTAQTTTVANGGGY